MKEVTDRLRPLPIPFLLNINLIDMSKHKKVGIQELRLESSSHISRG